MFEKQKKKKKKNLSLPSNIMVMTLLLICETQGLSRLSGNEKVMLTAGLWAQVWVTVFSRNRHTLYKSVSSVTQSCLTLCNPMDCSMQGLPVHHQLLEFTQTHVHWVSDAIQPSHPLSSPSPPTFNLSQHQGLFKWDIYNRNITVLVSN